MTNFGRPPKDATKPRHAYLDGAAVILVGDQAWVFIDRWEKVHPAEVMNAKLMSAAEFRKMFPHVPSLPWDVLEYPTYYDKPYYDKNDNLIPASAFENEPAPPYRELNE